MRRKVFAGGFARYGIGDSIDDLPLPEAPDISHTFPCAPEPCRKTAAKVVDAIL